MRILAIETSTDTASLAGWCAGALVWGEDFPAKRSLCADLAPRLALGLGAMGGVDRVVVGLGPGSYAGVRIAIATAMGLQAALGCELVGVPSAVAMQSLGAHFTVAGDARRGTWYFSEVTRADAWLARTCWTQWRDCWRRSQTQVFLLSLERMPNGAEARCLRCRRHLFLLRQQLLAWALSR